MLLPPPRAALFPYTTLFRSTPATTALRVSCASVHETFDELNDVRRLSSGPDEWTPSRAEKWPTSCLAEPGSRKTKSRAQADRKSTRLNSSHVSISYAVFCLK